MKEITQNLNFHLNENGYGEVTYSKWTAGITIQAEAQILRPKGNYHVELFVNGKRQLSVDVTDNQEVSAKIKTPFFKSTNIKVTIHSKDICNQNGTIRLDAKY